MFAVSWKAASGGFLSFLSLKGVSLWLEYLGTAGNDLLQGVAEENDYFKADSGDDTIEANGGSDSVRGGKGQDTIYGGEGSADIIVYESLTESTSSGADYIGGFAQGTDLIDLSGLGFTGIQSGSASGTLLGFTSGSNFTIGMEGNITLTVNDFIFS